MGVQVAGLMIITLAIMVLTLMSQVAVTSELETTSAAAQTIDSTGSGLGPTWSSWIAPPPWEN